MSYEFLDPASSNVVGKFESFGEQGVRGRSLVGVSILSAGFINVCWPLAALLMRWPGRIGAMRKVAFLACVVAPVGALMSYSRGPIAGTILIIVAVLLFGLSHVRRGILFPTAVVTAVVLSVGFGSSLFMIDRLTTRTAAIFTSPLEDERESERLLSYVEPFEHVMSYPSFVALGEGVTVRYAIGRTAPQQRGKATHSIFSIAYYSYGLIAAIMYFVLIGQAFLRTMTLARSRRRTISRAFAQALFLAMLGLLPWAASAHGLVSGSRGSMLLFFVLAMVASLDRFAYLNGSNGKIMPNKHKSIPREIERRSGPLGGELKKF